MAKARTLVGLDVHATKVVAAVLDVETGELAFFSMTADIAGVAGFALVCPVRCGRRMRQARPGTGWRGSSRGVRCSALPAPTVEAAVAARDPVRGRGRVDHSPPAVVEHDHARAARRAGDAAGRARRGRCAGAPPRAARAVDHRAAARLSVERAVQPAAMHARARHADRGRVVRRGRRLRQLPQARAADELPRTGPLRDEQRPAAQARVDHQDRLHARAPAVGRGCLALPQTPADRHHAHRTTSRPATRGDSAPNASAPGATARLPQTRP